MTVYRLTNVERARAAAAVADDNAAIMQASDQHHMEQLHTGVVLDRVTFDYQAWLAGRVLGWAPSRHAARALIAEQLARIQAHQ